MDLRLRGPGTIYGVRQSGADPLLGRAILNSERVDKAFSLARQFIEKGENLKDYPQLQAEIAKLQRVTHLN